MKKENRKLAQERRAKERRKKERRRKLKKVLLIGIPILAVMITCGCNYYFRYVFFRRQRITRRIRQRKTRRQTTRETPQTPAPPSSTDTALTVEDGDTVNIDYVGTVDGEEFSGGNTNGAGTDLVIGSGSYIDDFEDQLIGAHPGDTVEVTVTFPEDYGVEELNGKEAVFTVTVNGIYE